MQVFAYMIIAMILLIIPAYLISLAVYRNLLKKGNRYPMSLRILVFVLIYIGSIILVVNWMDGWNFER